MKPEELLQTLMKMQKETKDGTLNWRLDVQTTEGNEKKYTVEEDEKTWMVDECYVSYHCTYRGKEFCLISYEMIKTSGREIHTSNYLFLPPLGVRLFSLETLLPHSIEADAVLVSQVHMLWELLMELVKKQSPQVEFHITEASVNVEDI
ncbi:hypothetical protein H8S17_04050 [Roseburia sp. BX1005]|uniref:Uncharacterized protein n=1 Tax=Roseburia zhanii TaxID=2763064 RepID=A0A923RSA4_9FIRM|nr:hypothetical protein [Roseburia zhanii]MBC5713393.1 hypothetical protein [Roseburia zhanii]